MLETSRPDLQRLWSETSWKMQSLRDDPDCADEAFQQIDDDEDPGLSFHVPFNTAVPMVNAGHRPRAVILREQGVNGHVEMAAAFDRAGFDSHDVHMSDVLTGAVDLDTFNVLAACGGFSYGDVLGAGGGWANAILHNPRAREAFETFFHRSDTLTLGVCNGCQMLSQLTDLIPHSEHWPLFLKNRSEQFEARLVMCEVLPSPSLLLAEMAGARLPVAIAHGEGRSVFSSDRALEQAEVCLRFIDNYGREAIRYPANPNGSVGGITAVTTRDGRATIMMPHPERVFRTVQYSWHPDQRHEDGPWLRMFRNARLALA